MIAGAAAGLTATNARANTLKLRDLYNKDGSMSDMALSLTGQRIVIEGYMAPPLRAVSKFFVLTKQPMAICPFCEDIAEWPADILAVYTKRIVDVYPFNFSIEVSGVLDIGEYRDDDTGFVSLVRLIDSTYS